MTTRVLSFLLLLAFGHAALVPPCDMHGVEHGASGLHGAQALVSGVSSSHGDHATSARAGSGTSDERESHDSCTCLGDCHAPLAYSITPAEGASLQLARTVAAATVGVAPQTTPVAWLNQPYVLPFATAPPVVGG